MIRTTIAATALLFLSSLANSTEVGWDTLQLPSDDREANLEKQAVVRNVANYVGHPISVRGHMMISSVYTSSGIKRFVLWAETKQKPINVNRWKSLPLHYIVVVEMEGDATADFVLNSPVKVTGQLVVDILRLEDGTIFSVYKIRATSVSRAQKREGFHKPVGHGC